MPNDRVIQGEADLNIAPFLAKLAQLEAAVNASVTNIGIAMQRMAATATQGVNQMQAATVATGAAATQTGQAATNAANAAGRASNAAARSAHQVSMAMAGIPLALQPAFEKLKRVEDGLNSIYRAGAQLGQVSMTTVLFGGAVLGLEAAAIKSAAGVDFWSAKTIAAAKAAGDFMQGSAEQQKRAMSELPEMVRNVAVETGQKADEIAESMYRWQSASGAQIRTQAELWAQVKQVTTIVKAAAIADVDQAAAIRGVVQILGSYDMSVMEASRVTEVLSNTAQTTNAEFVELIESAKYGAAAAARLDIPFEQFIGTLGKLSDVGQKGTAAGRGLQQFLQGLVDPGAEAADALNAILVNSAGLGDNWRDILFPGGEFVGLMDQINEDGTRQLGLIGILSKATEDLTQADREQFFAKITSQNAYRVLSPLIQQYKKDIAAAELAATTGAKAETMSLEALVKSLSNVEERQKSFNDQWEIIAGTIRVGWGAEMERLLAGISTLGTTASGALLPLVHEVGTLVLGIRGWALENPKLFTQLVTFATIMAALAVAFGTFGFFIGQAIQGFTSMWIFAKAGFDVVSKTLGFFGLAAIPQIVAIIAAIAALSVAWRTNFLGMAPILQTVASAVRDTLGVALIAIGNLVKIVVALFQGDWQMAWDSFQDIVVSVLALVSLYFQKFSLEVQKWGGNIIGSLASGMLSAASSILGAVLTTIGNIIAGFFRGMSPPKEGPLSEIDRWGDGVMKAYADGLRRGADKHIKPAAKEAAKAMSGPLEGHSPAKEGPLSEISEWGTNLMDAFLRGFQKADFSILNEMANTVSTYLKNLLSDKKISPASFLGNMSDARNILAEVFATIRQGGQLAADAFSRIKQIAGGIGDDIEKVAATYKEVVDKEKELGDLKESRDWVKESKEETFGPQLKALDDESKLLQTSKYQWTEKKQAIDDAVEALERQQWPLQDEQDAIKSVIETYRQKISVLEETKEPIQAVIDGIRTEIEGHREASEVISNRLSDLRDEKSELQDQINAVKERYDKEKDGAKAAIDALRDQLSLVKSVNAERLKPSEEAVKGADRSLDAKRKSDRKEEEVLERRIADYRARGVAPYYINQVENQLRKLKESHEDQQGVLEDAKDAAQDALDKAKEKAQLEEESVQRQIDLREQAEKTAQLARDAAIQKETAAVQSRIAAIEKEEQSLNKRAKEIDREIASDEKRIKAEDAKSKNIDKDIAAINKNVMAEEKRSANVQKELDILNKNITWLQRREKVYDDELKAIERREGAVAQERLLIEQQAKPLTDQIALLDKKVDTAEKELKKAQDRLEIEKQIANLHEAERANVQAVTNAGKADSGGGGRPLDLGLDEDPGGSKPLQGLLDQVEEFKSKLKEAMHVISPELEIERARIKALLEAMGKDAKDTLIGALGVGGLIVFRGQIFGLIGAVAALATNFRLAFGPAGAAMGLNVVERLGVAMQAGWLVRFGGLLGSLVRLFARFSGIGTVVLAVFDALANNMLGLSDALGKVRAILGESIFKSITDAVSAIGDSLGKLGAILGVTAEVGSAMDALGAVLNGLGVAFQVFGASVGHIVLFLVSLLGGTLSGAITLVGHSVALFVDTIALTFATIKAIWTRDGTVFLEAARTWGRDLWNAISETFGAIVTTVWTAWNAIADAIRDWLHKIWGSGIIGDWLEGLSKAWGTFWNTTIPGIFTAAGDALKGLVEGAFNGIRNFLVGENGETGLWGDISGAISDILGKDDKSGLRGIFNGAWNAISLLVVGEDGKGGIVGGIRNFLVGENGETGLIGGMKTAVALILGEDDTKGLRFIFKSAFDAIGTIIETIKSPIQAVIGLAGDLITKVDEAIEAAKNLPGVQAAIDAAKAAVNVVSNAINPDTYVRDPNNPYGVPGYDNLPGHASGGIFTKEHIARIAEGGQPEVVMRVSDWLAQIASIADIKTNLSGLVNSLGAMQLAPAPASGDVHLHVGVLVADDRGLTELEKRLKRVRDSRNSRIV